MNFPLFGIRHVSAFALTIATVAALAAPPTSSALAAFTVVV
jgi:hypothetical protein